MEHLRYAAECSRIGDWLEAEVGLRSGVEALRSALRCPELEDLERERVRLLADASVTSLMLLVVDQR